MSEFEINDKKVKIRYLIPETKYSLVCEDNNNNEVVIEENDIYKSESLVNKYFQNKKK